MINIDKMKEDYLEYRKSKGLSTDINMIVVLYKDGNGCFIIDADELNNMSQAKRKKLLNPDKVK